MSSNRPLSDAELIRQFPPQASAGKSRAEQLREARARAERAKMRVRK